MTREVVGRCSAERRIASADSRRRRRDVAAPLDAAWDSIRAGLRRDLGARTFDGWLKPAELGDFDADIGDARARHAEPVHGRLGPVAFRRPADARLALDPADWSERCRHGRRGRRARARRRCWCSRKYRGADPRSPGSQRPELRSALPLRDLRRRQGQRSRRNGRPHAGRRRTRSISTRCSSTAAPGAARPTCCTRSATRSFARNRGARVVSMSAEKFMVEFVRAMRENDTIRFKQRLRSPTCC